MTADEALARLLDGNERYAAGRSAGPGRDERRRKEQAGGQTPFAVILGCADSRVPPEIVFDQGIGDVFVVRVAGNTAADDVTLGSIEFGASVLGCALVLVLGHERCGAVTAAINAVAHGRRPEGYLAALVDPILPAVEGRDLEAAVKANVRRQVAALAELFPGTTVAGGVYALAAGTVELLDA